MKIKKIKSNQTEERETINMMPGIVEKIKPQLRETCRENEFHTTHDEGKTNQPEKRNNQQIYLTDLFLSVRTKFDKSNTHPTLPWMKSKPGEPN